MGSPGGGGQSEHLRLAGEACLKGIRLEGEQQEEEEIDAAARAHTAVLALRLQ